jgi:hypothetical protein
LPSGKFAGGINNTSSIGKFLASVVGTGGKFVDGVVETGVAP